MFKLITFIILASLATAAHAYIGPGSGIGLLGSLWAWLVGILVVLAAIILWPIRRMLKRLRRADSPSLNVSTESPPDD